MASPARTLQVVGLPENKLAYTNNVFVNPGEKAFLTAANNYIKLNNLVAFRVKAHPGVQMGEVALNALQRKCCKLSANEPASAEVWQPPKSISILNLRLMVDVIGKRRADVKEDELAPHILQRFVGQPMVRSQVFCTDFQGSALKLTVMGIELAILGDEKKNDSSAITQFGDLGMLDNDSSAEIEPSKSKLLTFEKSASNKRSPLFNPDWKFADLGIGGLDAEFGAIFRRSFASRLFPPKIIESMGIKHVKGMLLHGPPGTGKTLIARQIGKILAGDREPKIVNGPEILNKYVGASEENIRKLFEDAESEWEEAGEASGLHIIIFDEIDAICKQRGSQKGGTGVHDTVVNQLLSKIDGVNSPNNILVIGMTNRKDMIDSALLRPGRLEVHVEIGLPDEAGRVQILNIHTRKMRESKYLSNDVNIETLAELTKNFSGAEIEGLVKSASSYALYGSIDVTKGSSAASKPDVDFDRIKVTMEHFRCALDEVKPAFGVAEEELSSLLRGKLIPYGVEYDQVSHTLEVLTKQVRDSHQTPMLSVLLQGASGTGKSAIAAHMAMKSEFPYIKLVSPEHFVGYSNDMQKCAEITKVFEDAYKSPFSIILLDDLERLLDYVPIGPRFSNNVLQTLQVLVKKMPPHEDRKLMIIATTSNSEILHDMAFKEAFNVILDVPQLTNVEQVVAVFDSMEGMEVENPKDVAMRCAFPIGIKNLLMVTEMARQDATTLTADRFETALRDCGLSKFR